VQKGGGGESRQSQNPVPRGGVLFCLKCGETGKPAPAVGFDEDGEAACDMHSVKAEIPAKPETVDEEKPDMPNEPTGEAVITLQLPAAKVGKLLALLLQ